jgi:hypothetical protein
MIAAGVTAMPADSQVACLNEDPDMFHPDGRGDTHHAAVVRALAVCRRCPLKVRADCLAVAWAEKPAERNVGKVAGGRYFPRPKAEVAS